jgi:hypothetical protein
VAALVPKKEIEKCADDEQPALQARLMNKALRKWQNALVGYGEDPAPTVVLINQTRIDVNIKWGSKIVRPAGRGQLFAGTVDIEIKKGKHPSGAYKGKPVAKDSAKRAISQYVKFIITKSLIGPPQAEGSYQLNLRPHRGRSPGTVEDEWGTATFAEMTEMFLPGEHICGRTFGDVSEMVQAFFEDQDFFWDVREELMDFLLTESSDWMKFKAWKHGPASGGAPPADEDPQEEAIDFD